MIAVTTNDRPQVALASEVGGSSTPFRTGVIRQSGETASLKWPVMTTGVPSVGGGTSAGQALDQDQIVQIGLSPILAGRRYLAF